MVEFLIQSFFDHLYPLAPAVHIPSFLADVQHNRQSRDLKFFALLISLLVVTVCTLPGAFEKCKELDSAFRFAQRKDMLEAGDRLIRQLSPSDYFDDPTLDQWACYFLLMLANGQQGLFRRADMHHAQAASILQQMNLDRVSTYQSLNKIKQQLGKKALWMNFTTVRWVFPGQRTPSFVIDKVCSHFKLHYMQTETVHTELTHLGDDADLLLPLEVDDHLITEEEVISQPEDRLSLVAGLNALTAINRTWMDSPTTTPASWLQFHQSNEATPDPGKRMGTCECGRHVSLSGPLAVTRERLRRLERCLDDLPPELAAEVLDNTSTRQPAISALLQSQYDAMRANVHVTHLWAQNHLIELIVALSANQMSESELLLVKEHCFELQKVVARKLLRFLNTLPKLDLLPNGLVLVSSCPATFRSHVVLMYITDC